MMCLSRHSNSWYIQLVALSLCIIRSSFSQSLSDSLVHANYTYPILFPTDRGYRDSVVLANHDCKFSCPHVVVQPETDAEVAGTIKIANAFGAEISVRGGGHGYTCQGSKLGSVMLDMRRLKSIVFNKGNSTNEIVSMTIGTGLTWGEVLKKLRDLDSDLLTVHGQCTSVGVAGYALHGGVHFGGLSELYGLASDNILALTAVVANGSTVVLSGTTCVIDGISKEYSSECSGLWFAFRGAGSSFGVVTSLTLRLHREPRLLSALSILSLKIQNSSRSQKAIKSYMDSIPKEASLTLFGLDAYFKAYSFTLLFSSKKRKAFFYDMKALLKRSAEPTVHFIVEASWISHSPYLSGSGLSHTRRGNNNYIDETHQKLKDVNKEYNATLGDYKDIVISREWLLTDRTWSVPSYDLVWGAGHSYGGATIIVDKDHEEMTIEKSFERFKMHVQKDTGKCSDCVIVFHRIGEKLKNKVIGGDSQGLSDKKLYTESFNPFRQNGSLWVEMDCGHFFPQRDSWPACSQFVDDAQAALDHPIPLSSKSHYPNVPNLVTESWREQYYGAEGYRLLQEVKQIWDPSDVFHHAQSVSPSTHKSSLSLSDSDSIDELFPEQITSMKNTSHDANEKLRVTCSAMYDRAANADLRNLLDLTRPLKHLKQRLKSSLKRLQKASESPQQ